MVSTVEQFQYSIESLRDEVRNLVHQGIVDRRQPIYRLCQYIPAREWVCAEYALEDNGFLLRDRIVDLLGREDWDND